MNIALYDTDLTDPQWKLLQPLLPKRWVVERTFDWLMQHRRLVRDYEQTETSATAWIFVAMIRIMLRRLA
jgi:putative transposase